MAEVHPKWKRAWESGELPWQRSDEVHPRLAEALPLIKGRPSETTFLLPMSGKALELVYLYRKGFRVVGIEYSEEGCKEVFRDAGMPFKMDPFPENSKVEGKVFSVSSLIHSAKSKCKSFHYSQWMMAAASRSTAVTSSPSPRHCSAASRQTACGIAARS